MNSEPYASRNVNEQPCRLRSRGFGPRTTRSGPRGGRMATTQRDREHGLLEAAAKYRVLVEHLPAIAYTCEIGTEGDWLDVSTKMEEILGWTPEEWMAHEGPWKASVHPDDIDRATEDTLAAAADGTEDRLVTIEYRMFTKDGRMLWIRDESTVVHGEDGNRCACKASCTTSATASA